MATCGLFGRFSLKNPKRFRWLLTNQKPYNKNERRHVSFSPWYMYFMLLRNFPDQKFVPAQTVLTKYYNLPSCWNLSSEFFALTADPRTTSGATPRGNFTSCEATRLLAASQPPPLKQRTRACNPNLFQEITFTSASCACVVSMQALEGFALASHILIVLSTEHDANTWQTKKLK